LAREFDIFEGISSNVVQKLLKWSQEAFPQIVTDQQNELADAAFALWAATAEDTGPWGSKYASTLVIKPSAGGTAAEVYTDEGHPNMMFVHMMEKGVTSWSIKKALLEGKAADRNYAKYGVRFVHVPFRHRTPGKTKATSSFASVMPEDVWQKAKAGEKFGKEYGQYAGLKKYSKGIHTGYFTFRTVSEKSEGWQHKGKRPTPVFQKVLAKVNKMIEVAITDFVKDFEMKLNKELK
jgi:hypothetical protein